MKLFTFEHRWLSAVLETILPSGADPRLPLGARDVPMDRFVGDLLARAPRSFGIGLRLCLWLVALSPLARGRFRLFTRLSPEERLATLESFGKSSIHLVREIPMLFKTVACLGYCGMPEVQRHVGISPLPDKPPRWAS